MHPRRAFSLIELLVVLSIIIVLAALLLPSIRQVKQSSKALVCLSNLRQIGFGMSGYAMDNQGVYPSREMYNASGTKIDWATWISPYIETDPNGSSSRGAAKGRVLKCPNYPTWGVPQSGTNAGYAINYWMDTRSMRIVSPGTTMMVSERTNDNGFAAPKELDLTRHPNNGDTWYGWTSSGDQYGDFAHTPIGQRVGGLFADIHVQALNKAQVWTCLKWKVPGGDL